MSNAAATQRKPVVRHRIDWTAALAFYLELGPERTYPAVARQFRVSTTSVGKHARKNAWKEAASDHDAAVAEKLARSAVLTRAQRVRKILGIVDKALGRYEAEVETLDLKLSDLPGLAKVAELLEGEATDRVSVGEVQSVIQTVFLVAGRFVPKERREEFLQELEKATAGLLDLGGAEPVAA